MSALRDVLGPDAADRVLPDYRGGSILNLPATVGGLLGVTGGWHAPPLARPAGLGDARARRVLLLVIDGLGWHALRRHAGAAARLDALAARYGGQLERLTSVVPATTSVATTVLLGDGSAPAETGMLGFSQRLPALDVVGNMLFWTLADGTGGLEARGLEPETFLPTASLFQVLNAGGVDARAFMPAALAGSPLSRLQFRGAPPRGTAGLGQALAEAGAALAGGDPAFAYVYHPDLDTVSHREGPGGAAWEQVLNGILADLEGWLADLRAPSGSWLLVTADHGLVSTPSGGRRWMTALDELRPLMACAPGGEPRHVYLYAREGAAATLLAGVRERLGSEFQVVDGRAALAAGLYGDPGRLHPEAARRVGDVVVLARGGATLWEQEPASPPEGMHGALEPEEMHVPLLALPLA